MVRRNKYGARKTMIDGIVFDSGAEARRYNDLKLLLSTGHISELILQPKFEVWHAYRHPVIAKNIRPITYCADFRYFDNELGIVVTEDVKGVETAVFKLKRKIVEDLYKMRIQAFKY